MSNAPQSALRGSTRAPGNQRAEFGGIEKSAVRTTAERPDFTTIQHSPEFRALRSRLKWFVFPATAFFLIWYVGYVIAAAYFPEFMAKQVWGEVNIGLLLGLGQFATTLALTSLYVRFARRTVDPRVDRIREQAGEDD